MKLSVVERITQEQIMWLVSVFSFSPIPAIFLLAFVSFPISVFFVVSISTCSLISLPFSINFVPSSIVFFLINLFLLVVVASLAVKVNEGWFSILIVYQTQGLL